MLKRIIHIAICILITLDVLLIQAQNLVPNPIFNEYSTCPGNRGQIALVPPWFSPNGGGVDYVNECAGNNGAGIPTNNWGHQYPIEGEGYAGVRVWRGGGLYREYLAADLKSPLEAGERYFLSFFVSPGDSMRYMTDDIGMFISQSPIPDSDLLPFQPLIANPQTEIINDFNMWKEISGEYVALGGEQHLVIGNFLNEEETTLILRANESDYHESAYFFVDNVVVENCKRRLPDTIIFADKKSLCPGEEIKLEGYKSPDMELEYLWSDGSDLSSLTISTPGEYELKTKINGCSITEKIKIDAKEGPKVDLGNDTTLCPGETLSLSIENFSGTWNWGNGSTEKELIVTESGTYYLEANLANCSSLDSIQVDYIANPPSTSTWDSLICIGTEVALIAGVSDAKYVWSDLSEDSLLIVENSGAYWVDVQTDCYVWRKTFTLSVKDCGCELFIPNIITPNGDGINDELRLQLREGIEAYHLQIFDRWGRRLFESYSATDHWGGIDTKHNPSPEGVYYWILSYRCIQDGNIRPLIRKGHISVLR